MAIHTEIHPSIVADILATLPDEVRAALTVPSHQTDLSGAEVVEVAEVLGIDFAAAPFSIEDLQLGLEVELELEQECAPSVVDLLDEDLVELGKAAVAHLRGQPDYYARLTQAHAPGDPPPCAHHYADVGND
jgi:hypothetical protein